MGSFVFRCSSASTAALALLISCLLVETASAEPRFESWAPLGNYERSAMGEGAAFLIAVPTRNRVVELSLRPNRVKSPRYQAVQLDRRGRQKGVQGPPVSTYAASLEAAPGTEGDFARLSYEPRQRRVSGLMRVDGILYDLAAPPGHLPWLPGSTTVVNTGRVYEGFFQFYARFATCTD